MTAALPKSRRMENITTHKGRGRKQHHPMEEEEEEE